jgi:hypothetical protein
MSAVTSGRTASVAEDGAGVQGTIRQCEPKDFELIWEIISAGASAYKGVIPEDCWRDP